MDSALSAKDFLKKVGGSGISDANAWWRGSMRPGGRKVRATEPAYAILLRQGYGGQVATAR